MVTVDPQNVGFFAVGRSESRIENVSSRGSENVDEYGFRIESALSNINIALFHIERENNGDADVRIFQDTNRNGRLDTNGTEPAIVSNLRSNGINEFINVSLSGGHYVIGNKRTCLKGWLIAVLISMIC